MPTTTPAARRLADWTPYATGFLAVAVLLVALAGVSIWQERGRHRALALAATQNLARLLEAHVADALNRSDLLLQTAAAAAGGADTAAPGGPPVAALAALRAAVPDLRGLRLADRTGQWQLPPAAAPAVGSATDDEAFQRLRAAPGAGLVVTGPLRHAPQAPWVLVLSRALRAPDGGFAGMVSLDLPVTRFDALFSSIDLGEQGAATLRTASLALVYRHPWPRDGRAAVGSTEVSAQLREAIAANPLAGDYEAPTALDGIARINTYRKVQDYPLYLLVGLPEDDFPRGWNALDGAILALAGAVLGAAALGTVVLYRATRRLLGEAQQRVAAIVESSQDAIVAESADGVVLSWNPGAEAIFGWRADEMLGQSLQRLVPAELRADMAEVLARVHRGERVAHFETERLRRDGHRVTVSMALSPLRDGGGRIVGAAHIARDITRQKAMEEEVRQLAFHDPLTRLPNRRLLMDRLQRAQQTSKRLGSHAALLFLDLDHFKALNDRLGHEAGDQLLTVVAQRLTGAVRETDTVARLGGDEFVVVCENLGADRALATERVLALAAKVSEAVTQPVVLQGELAAAGLSLGHRLFLGTDEPPERLLADADQAMYRHKQRHRPVQAALAPLPDDDEDGDDDGGRGG